MSVIDGSNQTNTDSAESETTSLARAPTAPPDTEPPEGWESRPGFYPAGSTEPVTAPKSTAPKSTAPKSTASKRTSKRTSPRSSTSKTTSTTADAPPTAPKQDVLFHGLGDTESVFRSLEFDGDMWAVIRNSNGGRFRMVRVSDKMIEGVFHRTYVQIVDGLIECHEIRSHITVDRKTRRIGTEQISVSYRLTYTDNQTPYSARTTTITADDLNKDARPRWGFLSRLGLDAVVGSRKYGAIVELIKAVNWCARSTATRVRVVNQTGIIIIDDVKYYANASGTVIGPEGETRTDVICEPDDLDQYRDIGYTSIKELTDDQQSEGLQALQALHDGHSDKGITGLLIGQLIGSLVAGTQFHDGSPVNSLSGLVGLTETGKTAYAMAVFTSQTQSHYGEALPAIVGRITPGKGSGGATSAGIYHKLKSYSGIFALIDDVIKAKWEMSDKRRAHDLIVEKSAAFVIGGGTPQAQPDNKNGGVKAAPAMHLELSGVLTLEDLGANGSLMLDSTYNRMTLIWWDVDGRAPRETFEQIISEGATLRRNDGLSVCLASMLKNPALLSEGYRIALEYLRANLDHSRVAKSYARCLAGLHVLDSLCKAHGIRNPYSLTEVLPFALIHAQKLESSGTDGGDEIAVSDPLEATREGFRILTRVKHGAYATAPVSKQDIGKSVVPEEPELPDGQDMTIAGWFAIGKEGWTHPTNGIKIGEIKKSPTNGRDQCPYPYRLECTAGQWADLDTKLGEINRAFKHHAPSRQERVNALRKAGILLVDHRNRGWRYQLDWQWLTGLAESPDDADALDEGDDE